MKKAIMIFLGAVLVLTGCAAPQTNTGKGATYGTVGGAAAGALAGQLIGKDTKGTLIGAAVGAAIGGAAGAGAGQMMDRQEQQYLQALAASEAASVRREGNLLAITLKGDVSFDTNSAVVNPGLYSEIDRIAQVMIQYPQTRVVVEGHTDSRGSDAYNMELSRKRAEAVRDQLVQRGISPSQIQTAAYGKTMPAASNNTAEGRQRNRRVEIKIEPISAG